MPDRSIFNETLLIGLEGDADLNKDGYITGSELGMFLQNQVVNYTRNQQHPQYGKIRNPQLAGGDFIIDLDIHSPRKIPSAEIPSPPLETQIDYSDLREDEETRTKWQQWQAQMEKVWAEVELLESDPSIQATNKAEAWKRALDAYAIDNPLGSKDELLRVHARMKLESWENQYTGSTAADAEKANSDGTQRNNVSPKPKPPPMPQPKVQKKDIDKRKAELINRRLKEMIAKLEAHQKQELLDRRLDEAITKIVTGPALSHGDSPNSPSFRGSGPVSELDSHMRDYFVILYNVLHANWHMPSEKMFKKDLRTLAAVYTVQLDRNGKVLKGWFELESGEPLFDASAESAVNKSRFPPLPEVYPDDTILIGFRFTPGGVGNK